MTPLIAAVLCIAGASGAEDAQITALEGQAMAEGVALGQQDTIPNGARIETAEGARLAMLAERDVLLQDVTLPDVLIKTDIPKLSLLPAGRKHVHATELLARNDDISDADLREALSGNLCRCTGYEHIVQAVRAAFAARKKGGGP